MSFKRKVERNKNKSLKLNVINRECGSCKSCCTIMAVEALKKPENEICMNQCDFGCSIQNSKPKTCAEFNCAWILGVGDNDDRPDKSGIMLDMARRKVAGIQAIVAHECFEHAFEENQELIVKLIERGGLVIMKNGGDDGKNMMIGPPEKMKKFAEFANNLDKLSNVGGLDNAIILDD